MDYFEPLSKKDLDRGMYFLQHKATFIRWAWILAGLLLILIYALLVFNLVRYIQAPSWLEISQEFKKNGSWSVYHKQKAPLELDLGQAKALTLGQGIYNLVATIKNPNPDWLVSSLEYRFVVNGEELPIRTSFLNASDQHLLLQAGYRADSAIGSVNVKISQVHWQRLSDSVPQVAWEISDLKYQPASSVVVAGQTVQLPAQVTWQAKNKSLFNFWEVGWQVALYENDNIIGVAEVNERDFESLESRTIEATWTYSLPRATRTEVWPILNALDKNNYKSAELIPGNQDRLKL